MIASPIDVSQIKRLDTSGLPTTKLSDDEVRAFNDMLKQAAMRPVGPVDSVYAVVKVNGKTVATLYNSGVSETSDQVGGAV